MLVFTGVRHIIQTVANQYLLKGAVLPNFFDEYQEGTLAIRFQLRLSARFHGYLANPNKREFEPRSATGFMDIILTVRHRAYVAKGTLADLKMVSPGSFKNVGNHESCWIESVEAELNDAYFAMTRLVVAHVPEGRRPRPADVTFDVTFSNDHHFFAGPLFDYVRVERDREHESNPELSGSDSLKSITPIKFKVQIEG